MKAVGRLTVVTLDSAAKIRERPPGARQDVHFTRAQVGAVLERYSRSGDRVLDPFSGHGTTVVVADELGRVGTGVELQAQRVQSTRERLPSGSPSRVVEGDARDLALLGLGTFDLCVTSPPYMARHDHPENPLTAFRTEDGDYETYLAELTDVFRAVARSLAPGGRLALCVGNFRDSRGRITPLAFDLAHRVSHVLDFVDELVFDWSDPSPELTGDYCLVFGVPT